MKKEIVIKSTVGLHASLAAKIVQAASNYAVDIFLHYKDETIDVKSILGLMSLAVPCGENVVLEANGENAENAINDIAALLEKTIKYLYYNKKIYLIIIIHIKSKWFIIYKFFFFFIFSSSSHFYISISFIWRNFTFFFDIFIN